jgi:hypothetical protein
VGYSGKGWVSQTYRQHCCGASEAMIVPSFLVHDYLPPEAYDYLPSNCANFTTCEGGME